MTTATTERPALTLATSQLHSAALSSRKNHLRDHDRIATLTFVPGTTKEEATAFVQRLFQDICDGTPRLEGDPGEEKYAETRTVVGTNCTQVTLSNRYWTDEQIARFDIVLLAVCRLIGVTCSR